MFETLPVMPLPISSCDEIAVNELRRPPIPPRLPRLLTSPRLLKLPSPPTIPLKDVTSEINIETTDNKIDPIDDIMLDVLSS